MKITDPYRKTITDLIASVNRELYPMNSMRHRGPASKGKKKSLRGYAYYPNIKRTQNGTFAIFKEAAYQIVKGTYYRCLAQGRMIIPRFK